MKFASATALLLVLVGIGAGQQPNTAAAAATFGGVNGPPWPIVASVPAMGSLAYQVSGAPNSGFLLAHAPAGLSAGAISTTFGLVDLNLAGGLTVLVDGITFSTPGIFNYFANTGPAGVATWSFPLPASPPPLAGLQSIVADPTTPAGIKLTAATSITFTQQAIYVSATTGAPSNPGTQALPVATITQGLALAGSSPVEIRVAQGTYTEAPAFLSGVSVTGGYDASTWVEVAGAYSTVNVGAAPALAQNLIAPTTIRSLAFSSPGTVNPGSSAIALRVELANVTFAACRFIAASGGAGALGPSGVDGVSGQAGGSASGSGNGVSGGSPAGNIGGIGGFGTYGSGPGGNGGDGVGAVNANGGPGGSGGPNCGSGSSGTPGGSGIPGANGVNGLGGSGGLASGVSWVTSPGTSGATGSSAQGGGGGGGGGGTPSGGLFGCSATSGGGGGGGGGGGSGGGGGLGGQGGGASIGVLLVGPSSNVVFDTCFFQTSSGSPGGAGGAGGLPSTGGPGGPGSFGSNSGGGGAGGAGGSGGGGGGGGGGSGGLSAGILRSGAPAPVLLGVNSFTIGSGGPGGSGGNGPFGLAPPGAAGASGTILVY